MTHAVNCRWPEGEPCRQFSTDGTRLGAEIAHEFGTTSELEISASGGSVPFESDVEPEQADWESNE